MQENGRHFVEFISGFIFRDLSLAALSSRDARSRVLPLCLGRGQDIDKKLEKEKIISITKSNNSFLGQDIVKKGETKKLKQSQTARWKLNPPQPVTAHSFANQSAVEMV